MPRGKCTGQRSVTGRCGGVLRVLGVGCPGRREGEGPVFERAEGQAYPACSSRRPGERAATSAGGQRGEVSLSAAACRYQKTE